jgi:hypothetical protein
MCQTKPREYEITYKRSDAKDTVVAANVKWDRYMVYFTDFTGATLKMIPMADINMVDRKEGMEGIK